MKLEYKPHLLEWTDEKVSRFWNFHNNYSAYDGTWFTEMAGDALLKLINKHFKLKDKILDYGTGKGFLLEHLFDKYSPIELYACDFTDSLAMQTDKKFQDHKGFKGCTLITNLPSAYEDNFFDFVFLIETIEHLTDNYLHASLIEIYRILKPGGILVITTPNEEVLEKTYVHCADCGSTFHHMQHVRSWNNNSLRQITERFGFVTNFCKAINLQWYKQKDALHYSFEKLKRILGKKYTPHLIYIGKKDSIRN
ncbi:MAG: class I SAM-dependent methyltransferase [Chitinophagaceae bacterium]